MKLVCEVCHKELKADVFIEGMEAETRVKAHDCQPLKRQKIHGRRLKAPVRNCGGAIKDNVCLRCEEYVI